MSIGTDQGRETNEPVVRRVTVLNPPGLHQGGQGRLPLLLKSGGHSGPGLLARTIEGLVHQATSRPGSLSQNWASVPTPSATR